MQFNHIASHAQHRLKRVIATKSKLRIRIKRKINFFGAWVVTALREQHPFGGVGRDVGKGVGRGDAGAVVQCHIAAAVVRYYVKSRIGCVVAIVAAEIQTDFSKFIDCHCFFLLVFP